ncbi:ATP-binding cassette domain-containing protein [Alkaliflexus imshenetskii]|uniref:ATP-binding cassette domain-containing protein n=1 Tax=Alkaliflexus imshenetskii TaxID=286730 RepID=UPI0004B06BE4|nr:ATP-binding cassette domain-containing protein [Alkaliflexus imshenetskii]
MSEGILKALMQLFALLSSPEQDSEEGRNIVRNYLSQQLNQKLVDEYLALFDTYKNEQTQKLRDTERIKKRYAASSVRVLRIATKINEELTYYQKLIVLIQLLEFLNSGHGNISAIELEFANTIAETFNIKADEYIELYAFITDDFQSKAPGHNLLFISGNPENIDKEGFLYREHLNNELRILNIHSASLLLIKSKRGTEMTLNGQVVQPARIYFMRPGSSLRHKRITPITYTEVASHFYQSKQKKPFVFEASKIAFKYAGSETGLHPMSFRSNSGSLVGIMGDSGAGKTTLINLLTGILNPQSGSVTINNVNIHDEAHKVKGLIGYVSQDDLLMEDLTVYQNLYYNARLCFDHLSQPGIRRKVLALLKSLGLYDIRNMKVGSPLNKKISGGQRKRLNIALELIREPSVMFMDEPTSGLSSRDSENIMDLLKELAQKGKLIYVVIHQPSSDIFKMFNQLLVLDAGGYLIYDGDTVGSINYFKDCINHVNRDENECPHCGNVSPEQILTIINSQVLDEYGSPTDTRRITSEEWYNKFHIAGQTQQIDKSQAQSAELPDITFKTPNRIKQFWIFMTRDVMSKLANRQYLVINLLESPLLAFILASLILYFEVGTNASNGYKFVQNPNLTVYIIIAVIIAIFIGLSVSAEEIISDKKILKRESFLNLSRLSYLVSKVVILGVLSAIQTGLLVLVGNAILEIKGMGMAYWMMLFSASVFANLLGLNISDSFKKTVNIYILIPFLIIPQLILSGVFVSYDQLNPNLSSSKNIPWYGELITARWAFEGLAVNQFKNNEYQKNFFIYDKLKSQATYRKDFWVPELTNQLNRYEKASEIDREAILRLIRNEVNKHNKLNMSDSGFEAVDSLTLSLFNESVHKALQSHLEHTKSFYIGLYNRADDAMENRRREIISSHGEEYLIELRNSHHNENLERFVKRTNDIFANRVIQLDDELIQKFDPIFTDPGHPFIKAHFLSPVKKIAGLTVDTYYVNLGVIWALNIILFVFLYAGVFQRSFKLGYRFKRKHIESLFPTEK